MVKLVYCVRRRQELSAEDFRKYWLEQHGPLVRRYAEALKAKKYVQSHTLQTEMNEVVRLPRNAGEPYDGITEIWWESLEEVMAAASSSEGQQANQLLGQDEARFVDLARSSLFFTEEHAIFG